MAVWLKCTKSVRNCNKLPSLGLCSNLQPAYLNPTKCFQPLSSVHTRPWKLWLGSEAAVAAVAAAPKWPFVHKNRAQIGPFCASAGGTDGNFLGLQHFPNVNTLQLKCFQCVLTCNIQYKNYWEFFNEIMWIIYIYTHICSRETCILNPPPAAAAPAEHRNVFHDIKLC